MKTLLARVLAIGSLVSLVMSVTAEETQAQTKKVYRGSIKDHVKTESRVEKRVSYERPPWAFEVPRQRVKPIGPPPVEISPIPTPIPGPVSERERVGISPIPTPIPGPVSERERVGISPIPTPIPGPVSERERVGISPIPTPIPHPVPHRRPVAVPGLLDDLLDMYTDAVLRGDLGAADLIEELIIIVPDYVINPDY